jgi:rubredoxin
MKMPVPFNRGDEMLTDAIIKKPNGNAIGKCQRLAKQGDEFGAIAAFLAGSIDELTGPNISIRDPAQIIDALDSMPWALAEWLTVRVLVLAGATPEVEVYAECPRCSQKYISPDPIRMDEMAFRKESEEVPLVEVELPEPVVFEDARDGQEIEKVSSLLLRLGTIKDCQRAQARAGGDDARLQYMIWTSTIVKHNGEDVTPKWLSAYGSNLFGKMSADSLRAVGKALNDYAMENKVKIACMKCGLEYRKEVPTASFFASGLEEAAGNQ